MNDSSSMRISIDYTPGRERLTWPLFLGAAVFVLFLHAAVFTVFTPLDPDTAAAARPPDAIRSTVFVSTRAMNSDSHFHSFVEANDPRAFLHPPESVGFSFFRSISDSGELSEPIELPMPPRFYDPQMPPPVALTTVVRPISHESPPDDSAPAAPLKFPFWSSDANASFPPFRLSTADARILDRVKPASPSVFRVKKPVLSGLPFEAVQLSSCGDAALDFAARQWLDTILNVQDCPAQLQSDGIVCRLVWTAAAMTKESPQS